MYEWLTCALFKEINKIYWISAVIDFYELTTNVSCPTKLISNQWRDTIAIDDIINDSLLTCVIINVFALIRSSGVRHSTYRDGRGVVHSYFFSWEHQPTRNLEVDWLDARNICRRHCMDAVSLETPQENEFIKQRLARGELSRWQARDLFWFFISPHLWFLIKICNLI